MNRLIKKWRTEAHRLEKKSNRTWADLGSEKLPQEDAIIYSVYEDSAAAGAYRDCANDLEAWLKDKPLTASDIGSLGGSVKSKAKKKASKENGKLGGRPKNERR